MSGQGAGAEVAASGGGAEVLVEHVAARVDERARRGVLNPGVRTVPQLCTVVAAAEHRRRGTGTRRVAEVCARYTSAGYLRVIGQVTEQPSMTASASVADLVVRPLRGALDLTPVLGVPTVARPAARHRLVHTRSPWSRPAVPRPPRTVAPASSSRQGPPTYPR